MICNRIRVSNFRNIERADVCFDTGVNILFGANAQGKTNLLEAISYTSIGKSFRTPHDEEMIMFNQACAEIMIDFNDSLRSQNMTVRMMHGKRRRIEQNQVKIGRVSDIVGQFRTVLFCPENLSLVKDGPAERRNYLDIAISQLYPLYLKHLQKYNQILKQRNQLIRNANDDPKTFRDTIESWSLQLAKEAAYISRYRYRYLLMAREEIAGCFAEMTDDKERPSAIYKGSSGQAQEEYDEPSVTEQNYIRLLTSHLDREIGAGTTLWGIHKDDIEILLNDKPARMFASQGQQRSLALSMKLAEGAVCRSVCGEMPVFLFDDVFSELDSMRRSYLYKKLNGRQVIITSCESDCAEGNRIMVVNGTYSRIPR